MEVLEHLRATTDSLGDLTLKGGYRLPFEYLSEMDPAGCLRETSEPHLRRYRVDGAEVEWRQKVVKNEIDEKQLRKQMAKLRKKSGISIPEFFVRDDTTMTVMVDSLFDLAEFFILSQGYYIPVLWLHSPSGWSFE